VFGMTWEKHHRQLRPRIGLSFQATQLPRKLTVRETVGLFCSFYCQGIGPLEALRRVGLEAKADARVESLSGGQAQRLNVACAQVGDPDLLLLDEPTGGLDPQARRQVWEIIREARGRGCTVVLSTHYMDEAEQLCDRVAIMDHGNVLATGSPPELIATLGGEHVIELTLDGAARGAPWQTAALGNLPGVVSIHHNNGCIRLSVREPHVVLPALVDRIRKGEDRLTSLVTRNASLDDVFVNLTGKTWLDTGSSHS
jgi:ABC-2 type transport system ATP-binding protein